MPAKKKKKDDGPWKKCVTKRLTYTLSKEIAPSRNLLFRNYHSKAQFARSDFDPKQQEDEWNSLVTFFLIPD